MFRSKEVHLDGLAEMLRTNWYLGLTSFGGPAVHFQIVCITAVWILQ